MQNFDEIHPLIMEEMWYRPKSEQNDGGQLRFWSIADKLDVYVGNLELPSSGPSLRWLKFMDICSSIGRPQSRDILSLWAN